jgi:hypothetical protein
MSEENTRSSVVTGSRTGAVDRAGIIALVAAVAPFVAVVFIFLWCGFVSYPLMEPDWYIQAPTTWLMRLGFTFDQLMNMGFAPAWLCGFCGVLALAAGVVRRSPAVFATGVWACAAVPVLRFLYMFKTF